jgi:hypothetical protein
MRVKLGIKYRILDHHNAANASSSMISTRMGSHSFTASRTACFAFSMSPAAVRRRDYGHGE